MQPRKNSTATGLLQRARAQGQLSASSFQALTVNADIGAEIQAGLGIHPDDVPTAEAVLVTVMVDDSSSIRFAGNSARVREGHNAILDTLGRSPQRQDVLCHTRYLNGHVLFPYRPIDGAVRMDSRNYNPRAGTPLYDELVVLLGTVLAKSRQLEEAGVPTRTITLVITDGADEHSNRQSAATVRPIIEDMLREERHTIAAMGISDGSTDFHRVFRDVGIRAEWILTPQSTGDEIRRAFHLFSQSAVRVSQAAPVFGGFGL